MKTAIKFLEWCNTPMCQGSGELSFKLRTQAQFPFYVYYTVIDESGRSIFPEGKFLTAEELFDYWTETMKTLPDGFFSIDDILPESGENVMVLTDLGHQIYARFEEFLGGTIWECDDMDEDRGTVIGWKR